MKRPIFELLESLRRGGDDAHETALALGLLIERAGVKQSPVGDRTIETVLSSDLAELQLTAADVDDAVEGLIAYLAEVAEPHPMAVWALAKSHDDRAAAPLVDQLFRSLDEPEKEHLAYQALIGITSFDSEAALNAIREAAGRGHGRVKETARQYLSVHSVEGEADEE